jgi:DHA3 family macrolide efflux protein-like MFS transporter
LIALIGLYPKSRTPFLLSLLAIFITLPVLVFGPIAGVLVDRWHKKKVMVICDSLRTACALAIPLVFILTRNIYPVFALVFGMFLLALFFNTARSAIIPNLVSKKRILTANSIINLVGRGATFLGMFLGGVIIDWRWWKTALGIDGWAAAFIIDALTFAISAFMLYVMKVDLAFRTDEEPRLQAKGLYLLVYNGLRKIIRDLLDAVKSIIKIRDLLFAISTILLMIIAGSVIYVLVIPIVQQEMAWGTRGVGILASVGAIGLLAGAYLTGIVGHRYDLKMMMLVCFVIIGGVLIAFPFLHDFYVFCLLCLIGGIAISPVFIGQDTLIHHSADEFIRGRIFSLRDWILNGSFALVALIIGSLATFASRRLLFVLFGAIVILGAALGTFAISLGKSSAVSPNKH